MSKFSFFVFGVKRQRRCVKIFRWAGGEQRGVSPIGTAGSGHNSAIEPSWPFGYTPSTTKASHDLSGLLLVNRLSTSDWVATWNGRSPKGVLYGWYSRQSSVGCGCRADVLFFFGFVRFWLLHCPEVRRTIWTRLDFDHKSSIHDIEGAYIILNFV